MMHVFRNSTRHPGLEPGPRFSPRPEESGTLGQGRGDAGGSKRFEGGFTLIEVMVSLLIFAMIATAGIAILTFSIRSQASTGTKLDDIGALNRTMAILSADLAQATDRPTRDERGMTRPAFVGEGNASAAPMLQFVRQGWSNLDGAPRASAQKVEYRVVGGALQRAGYPMLDGSSPMAPAILLTHVAQVALRYRIDGAWSDRWEGTGVAPLPQAVEVRLQRDDGTVFREMFVVGTGYAPLPQEASNGAP